MSGITVSGSTTVISDVTYAIRKEGENSDTTLTGKLYYFAPGEASNRKISWTGPLPRYNAYLFAAAGGGGGGSDSINDDNPGYGGGGGGYLISDVIAMNISNGTGDNSSIIFTKIGAGGANSSDGEDTIITTNVTTIGTSILSTYTLGKGKSGNNGGDGGTATSTNSGDANILGVGGSGGTSYGGALMSGPGSSGSEGWCISVNTTGKILFSAGGGGGGAGNNNGGNGGQGNNNTGGGGTGGSNNSPGAKGYDGSVSILLNIAGNPSIGGDGFMESGEIGGNPYNTTNGGGGGGAGYGGGGGGAARYAPVVDGTDYTHGGGGADGAVFVFVATQPPTGISGVTIISDSITASAFDISLTGGEGDNIIITATATDGSGNVIDGTDNGGGSVSFTNLHSDTGYTIEITVSNGISPDATWGPYAADSGSVDFKTLSLTPPTALGYGSTSGISPSEFTVYYTGGSGSGVSISAIASNGGTDVQGSVNQANLSVTFSSLNPLTKYTVVITATNIGGSVTYPEENAAPLEITTKPPTPQNKVTLFSKTSSEIVVTINPVTTEGINAALYKAPKFYIALASGYYLSSGTTEVNSGTYKHTITQANPGSGMSNLTAQTSYNIRWVLVANSDDESALSPELEVVTPAAAVTPAAPQFTVSREYVSPTEIRVTGNTTNETGGPFTNAKFYISTSDGSYILGTGSTTLNNGIYTHIITASPGIEYKIKWTLVSNGLESYQSQFLSVTTPTQAPVNPVVFISKTATQIIVRADVRDEAGGSSNYINALFYISRKTSGSFGQYIKDQTGPTESNSPFEGQYTHTFTVSSGSIYSIKWTFVTSAGESNQSAASEEIVTVPSEPTVAAELVSKTTSQIIVTANTNGQSGGPFTNVYFYISMSGSPYINDQFGTNVGEGPAGIYTYEFNSIFAASEYSIKWTLENDGGESSLSDTVSLTVTTPPAAPNTAEYFSKTSNQIVVTGNSTGQQGEPFSAAKFYISIDSFNYNLSNGSTTVLNGIYTHTFTGLTPSENYYIKWSLVTSAGGEGLLSSHTYIPTEGEVPSNIPPLTLVSSTATNITVSGNSSVATNSPFDDATFYISSDGGINYNAGTTNGPTQGVYTSSFNVNPGSVYNLRWTLTNSTGESLPSSPIIITTRPSAPSTDPVFSSKTGTQIVVTGDSTSESDGPFTAAKFYISDGGSYINSGTTSGPVNKVYTHTFMNLTAGNTYTIRWSLLNSGGESELSNLNTALSVTTTAVAGVPGSLSKPIFISSEGDTMIVTGKSSSATNGPFTGAKFYISNGGSYTLSNGTTTGPVSDIYTHTFTGLAGSSPYNVKWTLTNSTGESAQSDALSTLTVPAKPQPVTYVSKTSGQIIVTATSIGEPGGSFSTVNFFLSTSGGAYILDDKTATTGPVNGVYTHTFSGLAPGITYNVTWLLENATGPGIQSNPLTIITPLSAPGNATLSSKTHNQIIVTGSSSIATSAKFYIATPLVSSGAYIEDTVGTTTYTSGIYTHTFTSLSASTVYTIRWSLLNGGGESNLSDINTALSVTTNAAPAVPTNVSKPVFSSSSTTQIVVNGSISSATGSPFTAAKFYISTQSVSSGAFIEDTTGSTVFNSGTGIYTHIFGYVTPLIASTQYDIKWTLTNASGESAQSSALTAFTLPLAPGSATFSSKTSSQIVVTGTSSIAPVNGVSGAKFYIATPLVSSGAYIEDTVGTTTYNAGTYTHTFTSLSASTAYTIKWSVFNAAGESAQSIATASITTDAAAAVPGNLPVPVFVSSTINTIVVNGNSSQATGSPFSAAKFYISTGGGAYILGSGSPTGPSSGIYTYTFTSLTAGATYDIKWTLTNSTGESAQSSALTAFTLPSAPAAAIYSSKTSSQIIVTGTSSIAPVNGVSGAKFYIATPLVSGGAYIEDTAGTTTYNAGTYTHTFTSLSASTAYTIQWRVFNAAGQSALSVATASITTDAAAAVPGNLPAPGIVSSTINTIVVNGDSSQATNGPFTGTGNGAKFYWTGGGSSGNSGTTLITPSGSIFTTTLNTLTPGTEYSIRWTLKNATGESAQSSPSLTITTPNSISFSSKTSTTIIVTGTSSIAPVNGVSGAKFYIATPLVSSGAYIEDTAGSTTYTSGTYTHTFTGLTPSTAYTIKWRVFNAGGQSALSAANDPAITTTAAALVPSMPPAPVSSNVMTTTITVTGNSSSVTGSPFTDVTFYIGVSVSFSLPDTAATPVPVNGIYTHTFTGLIPSTEYSITWSLTNSTGEGTRSNAVLITTLSDTVVSVIPNSITTASGVTLSGFDSYVSATYSGTSGTLAQFTSSVADGSIILSSIPAAGKMRIWAIGGGGAGGSGIGGSGGGGGGGAGGSYTIAFDLGQGIGKLGTFTLAVGGPGNTTQVSDVNNDGIPLTYVSLVAGAAGSAGTNSAGGKGGSIKGGAGATTSVNAIAGTAAGSGTGGGGGGGGFSGRSGATGGAVIPFTVGTTTFEFGAGGSGGSTTLAGITADAYGSGGGGGPGNSSGYSGYGIGGAAFIWLEAIIPQAITGLNPANATISNTGFTLPYTGDPTSGLTFSARAEKVTVFSAMSLFAASVIITGVATSTSVTFTGLSPGSTYSITITTTGPGGSTTSPTINITTTGSQNPPCFLRGSRILCLNEGLKEEYIAIENMRAGTPVKTLKGTYVRVHTIGKAIFNNPDNADRGPKRLFRLTPQNYPELTEDLIVTGCHSILVDKLLPYQKARHLQLMKELYMTTGKFRLMAFIDEKAEPYLNPGDHEIWHFALENEVAVCNYGVYANGGLLVETASIKNMTERSGLVLIE